MIFTADKLKEARDAGYSDDEIWGYTSSTDDRFNAAKSEGYSLDEVASFFSSQKPKKSSIGDMLQGVAMDLEDTIGVIGRLPEALVSGIPAQYQKLVAGTGMPEKSEAIESDLEFQKRNNQELEDRAASGKLGPLGKAFRQAAPSIAGTGISMVAAIPGGIIGGAFSGPAAPVGGFVGAAAASGAVSYRMQGADYLYRAFKQLEENKGSPLTDEEKAGAYEVLLPLAQESALWEAGPEAIGNAVSLGVGKFVFGFGKAKATQLATQSVAEVEKTLARKITEKSAAIAGGAATEVGTETITALGQYAPEMAAQQYVKTGTVEGAPTEYPGGIMQAVKDVAPATLATQALVMGAGGAIKLATVPFANKPKTPEQIAEDNINIDANAESVNLSIDPDDEVSKGLSETIKSTQSNLISKKEIYSSLEPTDDAAQILKLEIKEDENKLILLQSELNKRTGVAIPEVEKQQAKLIEEITTPVAEKGLTVPPVVQAQPKTREGVVSELEKREAGKDRLQELASAGERLGEESQILDDILGIDLNSKESENLSNQEKITRLAPEQRIEYGNRLNALVSQRLTIPTTPVAEVAPAPTEPTIKESLPVAKAPAPTVVEGLQAVSENVATPEQLTELSQSGLVDIVKGQPVINEEGQAVLTQAEAPLPKLTPEERLAEIEAAPVAETPLIFPEIDDQTKINLISEVLSLNELSKKVTQNEKTKAEDNIAELTGINRDNIEYVRTGPSKVFRNKATGEYIKLITPSKSKIDELKRQIEFLKENAGDYAILPDIQPLILDQEGGGAFLLIQKPAGIEGNQVTFIEGRSKAEEKNDSQLQEELFNQTILGGAAQDNGILRAETDRSLKNLGLVVGNDGMVRAYGFDFDGVTQDTFDQYSEAATEIAKKAKPMKGVPLSDFSKAAQEVILSGQAEAVKQPSVAETPAVTEAPAAEVAPSEQVEMPKNFEITGKKITKISTENGIESATKTYANALNKKGIKTEISYDVTTTVGFDTVTKTKKRITSNDNVSSGNIITPQGKLVILSDGSVNAFKPIYSTPAVSETITPTAEGISIGSRIKLGRSPQTYVVEEAIPQTEIEKANNEQSYSVKNERTGEVQVVEKASMKQVGGKKARKMAGEVISKQEVVTPIPEANRYTFEEAVKAVDAHFGKKGIPEGVVIVNNTTDKDLEMRAGYFVNRGQIVINLAYIAKGENLGDIIDHELGHYIFGDPKFQDDFKQFWDAMTPEEQAQADQIINQFYNQETGAIQVEEKQVRAFMQLIQESKAMPKWKQLLDTIKRWINEKLGTNFQVTDRGAMTVLAAAHKRFKSGEQIIREIDSGVLKAAETAQDAEYLAAVERGDMETAQMMVDEAAKKAGYNSPKVYHGSSDKPFNIFKTKRGKKGTREGGAFFTPTETLANFFAMISQQQKYGGITDKPGIIYKAYLKMDNPIVIDQEFENVGSIEDKNINRIKAAKKYGYDGIIWKNTIEPFHPDGVDQYIVFNPEQIKSADPVTYDDAGNVIPLSQRFRATSPDIRRMAAERQQVGGMGIGETKKTPKGIIAETQAKLRERFNPSKVTEENTTEAFRSVGRLLGKEGNAFAEELNDITRMIDESGAASEISMGAALFVNDLFEYSVRLASEGQKMLLGIMLTNINRLPTAGVGRSDAGRTMRAAKEMNSIFEGMAQAERDAFTAYAAEFVYGPNPTKEQIDSIKKGYEAAESVKEPTTDQVIEGVDAAGVRSGVDLVAKINTEFTKSAGKKSQARKSELEELDAEYKKVQNQANSEIEKLAKIQSDTPSFARKVENEIRSIISNDLKQRPNMGRKEPWKAMLVGKLQMAGVEPTASEILTDIVWRQHEINNLSRELDSINKAVEKGPINEIINAIKNTPLEEQQNPKWRYEVMLNYLRKAGLTPAQAERIAKLMDLSIQKRFIEAKEKAFSDAISKTAPWKEGNVRSKRAFKQVIETIRAGALDPARNMISDIAAMNGWTGFSADQYKKLLEFDKILANDQSADVDRAEAYKGVQDIISKSKLPIRAREVIAQYYDAQALSGIPTFSVNTFSPIAFAMRNALIESSVRVLSGDIKGVSREATVFVDSIRSWANTVAYSFKNNVTVYSNVDYIVNDDKLLQLFRKGVEQFNKGKTERQKADGIKNMLIGMMDYVRRILNALDYGAIQSVQNQNIGKYAMAVMRRQGMNNKEANEMFGVLMKAKGDFYIKLIAAGEDKNKAGVLADEYMISAWIDALDERGVKKSRIQEALNAALNDAMSTVGRNRQSLDSFKGEETNIKDSGVFSFPPIRLLENIAAGANKSENAVERLFARALYGFAITPARVLRETAWFSPYGFVRFGYDAIAKKMGKTSPYAQSLGNDLQRRQRLIEATAATVATLGLYALITGSTDDPDDKKPFKITFTGNGPRRKDDVQFHDSWYKVGNKPNSMILSFGKTNIVLNMIRGFEAFTWPAIVLGAVDDWEIRKKQKRQAKTEAGFVDAAIVAGFVFDAGLKRGPYAFTTKSLFGAYGDTGVETIAKGLTFPAKTLIPVLGSSFAMNISNFINDPIDRRTLEGALWSNIPLIGPVVAPKSYNAFAEPALSTDLASKAFKLGVPIVFDIPSDRESVKIHELILKQGGGPSLPTRTQLAQRLDMEPTNKEYEVFVKEYGFLFDAILRENYEEFSEMAPDVYSAVIEKIGLNIRDAAEEKVRESQSQNVR